MGTLSKVLCLLLLCCTVAAVAAGSYKDPKQPLGARIRDLMKRMTLQEKIGQMVQIERSVATPEVMKKYFIGMQKKKSEEFFLSVKCSMYCLKELTLWGFCTYRECVEWWRKCAFAKGDS